MPSGLNQKIKMSLDGFNASRNCDRTTPETFYSSYLSRKKQILAGKLHALERGSRINHEKLRWEIYSTNWVRDNKDVCMNYIKYLLTGEDNAEEIRSEIMDLLADTRIA